MKARRNIGLTIAALALVGILASTANAQQALVKDAHFTLPFRATWADTVLPPGDYAVSVIKLSGLRDAYRVTFDGGTKRTILVTRRPGLRVGKRSMLVAVRSGEMYSISAIHLPEADLVLTFSVPKANKKLLAKVQSVPILIAAK